jgi:hypothetical protein
MFYHVRRHLKVAFLLTTFYFLHGNLLKGFTLDLLLDYELVGIFIKKFEKLTVLHGDAKNDQQMETP